MPRKDSAKRKVWKKKIEIWKESGLSARKWCLENGENYHRFRYWRQTLKEPKPSPIFEELKEEDLSLDIELSYGELKILFPKGCRADLFEMCLKSIQNIQCSR